MMRHYISLTKPGILMGNALTAASGFFVASRNDLHLAPFLPMLIGLSLIIASACVFNNYFDAASDYKMSRTQQRPMARGLISKQRAALFASLLLLCGLPLLCWATLLGTLLAVAGFIIYVLLYTLLKHHSRYATQVGSLAGAMPPVVGYVTASQQIDRGALFLFAILLLWQMPHFFSIAIHRLEDYRAAAIPVLPLKKGLRATKIQMVLYILLFLCVALLPIIFDYAGYLYLVTAILLSSVWLALCLCGFKARNDQLWARNMFRFSLVTITGLSIVFALDVMPVD
jgi:heme o synthase